MKKNKVGRPRLADEKTKKESFLLGLFVLIIIIIVGVIEFKAIMMEFSSKYSAGTLYNDHIKSCIIKDENIDCGPLVTNMKYKIDNNNYVEIEKEEKNIKINLKGKKYYKLEICSKTSEDYSCHKY